ncbi:ThuA domain-containing protein [Paenibacillus sp. EKM102P]|uniref:ThuA domain-containing protein n=1 Tax=unclassified Paenibacillus TaxID=185978 RepID=UPI00142D51DA|nr:MULTISPECIES: ThuA domain-containing protein [unclassified Paenibacillus]KAF6616507.1 ThuA domain-containing protein [Paenibacillus sp. EKM101P]KAF6623805.1 ThuA domain-containing protein [Paenibacillus sp. EKM102P]KAF6633630.1 ThuA domain-containing protein [Paenibacillus sp. EKM10P]KAF6649158.1 ThuA domain-containing protein [Paenibacillus sp. EKM11P]
MHKALIVWGGWNGHEPEQVAAIFERILKEEQFEVEVSNTLDAYQDAEKLLGLDLIIPMWTMGQIEQELVNNVSAAVQSGVGLAGCHGGMCDAFRNNVDWQFMTGGQWVAHPGNDGVEYMVNIKRGSSPLLDHIEDFQVKSEQYYLHVDPAVEVLATTRFPVVPGPHSANGPVDMPVVWTKRWGSGRVFYNSLGHHADIIDIPQVTEMMRSGFLWTAAGKQAATSYGSLLAEAYTGMADNQQQ